jgi:hypothetical protein
MFLYRTPGARVGRVDKKMETRTWPKCAQLAVVFNGVTPKNFHFLLEKIGFHLINRWDEADIFVEPASPCP